MKAALCLLVFAGGLAAQTRCAIQGVVVDALTRQPLARARVFAAMDSDSDSAQAVRRITDAHGVFCFEDLAAGEYQLRAARAFYIDTTYGEHRPGGRGQRLAIAAGKPRGGITIEMTPQAGIGGQLVDADGEPLGDIRIELLKARWKQRKVVAALVEETTTDDQGRYRFAPLVAGTYFISAIPRPARRDEQFPMQEFLDSEGQPLHQTQGRTYYKDATSFRSATPVHVAAGQEINGIILSVRTMESRHVTGQVSRELLTNSPVLFLLEEGTGNPGIVYRVAMQENGRFRVDGLFPDSYLVLGVGAVKQEIDLANGDVDDLTLEPDGPIELQIKVDVEGSNPQGRIRGLALGPRMPPTGEGMEPIMAELVAENKFQAVVRHGAYEFRLDGDGSPYFIRSLKVDGEAQARPVLNLDGATKRSIYLVVSSGVASVEGHVTGSGLIRGSTILVEDESDPESRPQKVSSTDGQFRCALLHAGRYRLYAFEDFDQQEWENPELATLLAAKSALVEAKEGQHLQVNLPLITAGDFTEAVRNSDF